MLTKVEMGGAMDNRAFKTPVLTARRIWECEQCVKKNTYTNTIWTTLRIDSVCVIQINAKHKLKYIYNLMLILQRIWEWDSGAPRNRNTI